MPQSLITVTNLPQVQAFVAEAPRAIVASGFAKALSAAANVFADEVEILCPVKKEDTGGLLEKGVLRESIMVSGKLDSQFRGGYADVGWGHPIPPNLPLWVEKGHRLVVGKEGFYIDNQGRRRRGRHVGQVPAHPFVGPAFDNGVTRATEAFARSLDGTVKAYSAGALTANASSALGADVLARLA